jgi:hypothetical protein
VDRIPGLASRATTLRRSVVGEAGPAGAPPGSSPFWLQLLEAAPEGDYVGHPQEVAAVSGAGELPRARHLRPVPRIGPPAGRA